MAELGAYERMTGAEKRAFLSRFNAPTLEQRIVALEAERNSLLAEKERLTAERDEARAQTISGLPATEWLNRAIHAEAERDAAVARAERAEAALREIAAEWDGIVRVLARTALTEGKQE